jgi:MFS family permease
LFDRSVLAILVVVATATMVLSGTDIGIVSTLREANQTPFIAWAMAAWCTGSLVGGLIYGGLHRTVSPWLLLLGLAALTGVVGLARTPWQLALLLVPAGALCAPVITATVERITILVPEQRRGEAMGWHGSALTVGSAMGSPATGAVIDLVAPWAGFVAIGAAGVLLALGRGMAGRLLPRQIVGAPEPVPVEAASHLPS